LSAGISAEIAGAPPAYEFMSRLMRKTAKTNRYPSSE
jgi:hypothetical protein